MKDYKLWKYQFHYPMILKGYSSLIIPWKKNVYFTDGYARMPCTYVVAENKEQARNTWVCDMLSRFPSDRSDKEKVKDLKTHIASQICDAFSGTSDIRFKIVFPHIFAQKSITKVLYDCATCAGFFNELSWNSLNMDMLQDMGKDSRSNLNILVADSIIARRVLLEKYPFDVFDEIHQCLFTDDED